MSFASPKVESPLSDNTPGRVSTFKEAEVVPLFYGRARLAVKWITPVLNWYFRNTKTSSHAFFSGVGVLCHGPIDEVVDIYVNGKPYNGVFKFREDYPGTHYIEHTLALETPETFRFWWGREDQSGVGAYINSLVGVVAHSMAGKTHPDYRGLALVGVRNVYAGRADGNTPAIPNIEAVVSRRSPTAYSFGYDTWGTHPVGAIYDILTDKRGGLGLVNPMESSHLTAQLNRLMSSGAAGKTGPDLFFSPLLAQPKEAHQYLNDALSYIDGWLRPRNGKLEIDWFPNDGTTVSSAGLREISWHDMVSEPQLEPTGLDKLVTQIAVTGLDHAAADAGMAEATEVAQVPYALQLVGEPRTEQINRPFFVSRDQLRHYAATMAAIRATPDLKGQVKVRRESATHPDGVTPLIPGDRFNLDYTPHELDLVVRVIERIESEDRSEVTLKFERERGASPAPYVPPFDPRAQLDQPVPAALTRYNASEVPGAEPREVAILVERPEGNASGCRIHYSPTNSWPGMIIDTIQTWACGALLKTALAATTGDVTVELQSVGIDWARIVSQSAAEQTDDRLLLIAGAEWFSVGTITVASPGVYNVQLKRARRGSPAITHAINDTVFLIYRAELPTVSHPEFSVVGSPEYFKLQPFNDAGDGPLTAVFSIALEDRTPAAPTNLTAIAGTGKSVSLDWDFLTGENISEYRIYRNTVNDPGTATLIAEVSATRFVDVDVALSTLYYYWVSAVDIVEQESPKSGGASVTTGANPGSNTTPPPTPGAMTVAGGGVYQGKDGSTFAYVDLNLPANSPVSLRNIYYRRTGSSTFMLAGQRTAGTSGTYRVDDLLTDVSYDFLLIDFNEDSYGSSSPTLSPVVTNADTTAPATPTGLTIKTGPGLIIEIDWADNTESDFSEYGIYRSTAGGPYVKIAETRSSRFWDTDVADGVNQSYKISAFDRTENESTQSSPVSATPSKVTDGQVDQTPPSAPSAASLAGSGTYNSGDGTVFSFLDISVPGMPAGAKIQNLLFRRTGATEWNIASQPTNTSTQTIRIDDLTPGVTYEVATRAFSFSGVSSSITTASGSPFTAPNKGTGPGAPLNITLEAASASVSVPVAKQGDIIMLACRVRWDPPADNDVAYYEYKAVFNNSSGDTTYTWSTGTMRTKETYGYLYDAVGSFPGFTFVRAINNSGVAGAWGAGGNCNGFSGYPVGSISGDNRDNVKPSGLRIGGGLAQKQTAQCAINTVVSPNTGTSEATEAVSLGGGFSWKPDFGALTCSSDPNVKADYDWDHGSNSASTAMVRLKRLDGGTFSGGGIRITGYFGNNV
jgi:fibronectin type 3 domain-containing protein